jgi:hypothetical protein
MCSHNPWTILSNLFTLIIGLRTNLFVQIVEDWSYPMHQIGVTESQKLLARVPWVVTSIGSSINFWRLNVRSTLQQLNQVLKPVLDLFDDILKRLSNRNPIVLSIFSCFIYCLMNSSQRKQLIKFPMVMTHIPRAEI